MSKSTHAILGVDARKAENTYGIMSLKIDSSHDESDNEGGGTGWTY